MGASCICETLQFISPFLVQCVTCFCETLQKSRCGLTHSRLRAQAQVGLKTAGDRQVQAHIMSRKLCRRSRSLTRPTFSRSSSRTTGDELKQIPAKALFYTRSTCATCPRSCRVCSPAGGPSRLKILVTLKADAEYRLKGNTDMRLRFMEPMTTEYTEVMMQLYDGDEVNKETLVADVTDVPCPPAQIQFKRSQFKRGKKIVQGPPSIAFHAFKTLSPLGSSCCDVPCPSRPGHDRSVMVASQVSVRLPPHPCCAAARARGCCQHVERARSCEFRPRAASQRACAIRPPRPLPPKHGLLTTCLAPSLLAGQA